MVDSSLYRDLARNYRYCIDSSYHQHPKSSMLGTVAPTGTENLAWVRHLVGVGHLIGAGYLAGERYPAGTRYSTRARGSMLQRSPWRCRLQAPPTNSWRSRERAGIAGEFDVVTQFGGHFPNKTDSLLR